LGRARVETAYDSVLMQRLKERQLGQLTGAAATASKREAANNAAPAAPALPRLAVLQNLPRPKLQWQQPSIKLAEEKQLWWPLGGHGLLLLLLLVVGNQLGTPELLLALASLLTIGTLQRRRSRLFAAVGLTIAALAVGLLIGSLISAGSSLPIGEAQFAAVPALLLLAATAVLFD
jgi:Protein CHAPERONE-LIKE PROTEIN OF POR1-like